MTDLLSDNYWTVEEVAKHLRVSKMTVYRLIEDAELEAVQVGRVYRIPEEALRRYLER